MTYRIPDVGMKMGIGTQTPEDPTTLPSTSDDHLQIKNPTTVMIVTAITRAISTHQSNFQTTRQTTSATPCNLTLFGMDEHGETGRVTIMS